MALPRNDLIRFIEDADRTSEEELLSLFSPSQPEQPVVQQAGPNIDPALLAERNAVTDASDAALNPEFFSASAMEDYLAKNPINLDENSFRNTFGGFDLNGGLKLNSPEEQKKLNDLDKIVDPLTQQILGQGLTGKWQGQGWGSAEANARDMAKIMAGIGITDIKQFGKVPQYEQAEVQYGVNGKVAQQDEDGNYYITVPGGFDYDGNEVTYRQGVSKADLQPVYGTRRQIDSEGNTVFEAVDPSKVVTKDGVPMVQTGETFGNKVTGQVVPNTYSERQTGNAWGGTFEGKGNTGYRVQFGPDGTPYFYTTQASSNDLANIMADLGPIAQIGLAVATGGMSLPAQLATNAAIQVLAGGDLSDIAKGTALSYLGGQAGNLISGSGGITDLLGKTGTDIAANAAKQFVGSGGKADIGEALLGGAINTGVNSAVSSIGSELGLDKLSPVEQKILNTGIAGLVKGQPLDQALTNAVISGVTTGLTAKPSTTTSTAQPLDAEEKAQLIENRLNKAIGQTQISSEEEAANTQNTISELERLYGPSSTTQPDTQVAAGTDTVASTTTTDTLPTGTQLAAVDSGTISDAGNGLNIQAGGEDTLSAAINDLLNNPQLKADEDLFKSGEGTLDTVTSGAGNDVVDNLVNAGLKETSTGDQVDSIVGATGNDTLAGAAGNDTVSSAGTDTVVAGTGNDTIVGSSSDPYFGLTQEQYDQLMGVGGNPESGTGSTVTDGANEGGEGGDITIGGGNDTVVDGSGEDTIDYGDDDLNELLNGVVTGTDTTTDTTADTTADTSTGTDTTTDTGTTTGDDTVDIVGGVGNDAMTDDQINDFLDSLTSDGTDTGTDTLTNDDILRMIGAESLIGGATNDAITGGATNDEMVITDNKGTGTDEGTTTETDTGTETTTDTGTGLDITDLIGAFGNDSDDTVTVTDKKDTGTDEGTTTGIDAGTGLDITDLIGAFGNDGDDTVTVTGSKGAGTDEGTTTGTETTTGTGTGTIPEVTITGSAGTCPIGTVYNPITGNCDPAWDETGTETTTGTDTGTETTTGTGTETTTGTGTLNCPPGFKPNEDGTACIPEVVITGKKDTCPIGTVYNPVTGNCDPAWDETGTGTGTETTTGTGTETTTGTGTTTPTTPTTPVKPTTPVTTTPVKTTPAPAQTPSGMDMTGLLALLAGRQQPVQQAPMQDPYAHIKLMEDLFGSTINVTPAGDNTTQRK